jgi:uncharacterized protein (DUF1330 family)
MAEAYWIVTYHSEDDPKALAEYAKPAGPAILSAGGRNFVRGLPAKIFEAGLAQRTAVVEFDSLAAAISAYESPDDFPACGISSTTTAAAPNGTPEAPTSTGYDHPWPCAMSIGRRVEQGTKKHC